MLIRILPILALGLALTACGANMEEKAATGGLGGAAAGAMVGGPVGAVVGAGVGAAGGAGVEKLEDRRENRDQRRTGSAK